MRVLVFLFLTLYVGTFCCLLFFKEIKMIRKVFLCVAMFCVASNASALTYEVLHTPSISSMQYRDTGTNSWNNAVINGAHGQFDTTSTLVDINIDNVWASHDFTGMTDGAFITVVGKNSNEWAFNYDVYTVGDEVTRWLPINGVNSIPEPSTIMLGSIGLLFLIRRNK